MSTPHLSIGLRCKAFTRMNAPLIVLFSLVTWFWWPALWHDQVILHVDSAHHSISIVSIIKQALSNGRELLWDSSLYGGHPLFAESQGGFLNPLNLLCAYFFEPAYAAAVLRWLNMLIGGMGTYCLARYLAIRPWSALFSSLAVVFSSAWIELQYNITVSAALCWLPWLIASSEYWFNIPTPKRALLMAVAAALLIFSGYPHIAYGAAIYLGTRLISVAFYRSDRHKLWAHRKQLLCQGCFAVLLAAGLAAIQLLPLIELAAQSHRSQGTEMPFAGTISLDTYLKSVVMFNHDPASTGPMLCSLSSGLCAILATAIIFLAPTARIVAHLVAGILLLNLGMETQSPLFRLIYDNELLPGLNRFRVMHPFMPIAVIGIALAAAYSLDNIDLIVQRIRQKPALRIIASVYAMGWAALLIYLYDPVFSIINQLEPLAFILLTGLLLFFRQLRLAPLLVVILYSAGGLIYKSQMFNFYDLDVLLPPSTVQAVLRDPQLKEFKTIPETSTGIFVFIASNNPELDRHYHRYTSGLAPTPAASLSIPTLGGALALPIIARVAAETTLTDEIAGNSSAALGSRLIDVLGLRYIPLTTPTTNQSFELYHHDKDNDIYLYRNPYAKPRFQFYQQAQWVNSPQAALAQLNQTPVGTLLIEGSPAPAVPSTCSETNPPPQLTVIHASSMHYQVRVNASCPNWLFLADANYPGWQASIDEQDAPLYSANVLGKAVAVPAGEHLIRIDYVPRSVQIGLIISLMSFLLAAGIAWRTTRKRVLP